MPGVLLGSIQFVDREVPDTIKIGGQQKLAIHEQIGGTRVIDAMGPKPAPITWSGLFFGSSASKRARQVDELRKSGKQVPLSWGTFRYLVVVADFKATYKHEWEVRYSIKCEVVSNLNVGTPVSLTSIFTNDFANSIAIGFGSGTVAVTLTPTVLGNINSAISNIAGTISSNTSIPSSTVIIVNNALSVISGIVAQRSILNSTDLITINSSISKISGAVDSNSSVPLDAQTEINDSLTTIANAISPNTAIPSDVMDALNTAQETFNSSAKSAGGSIADVSLAQLQPTIDAANTALENLNSTIGTPTNGIDLRARNKQTSVLDDINNFANEVTTRSNESDRFTMRGYLGRLAGNLRMLGG